MQVHPDSYVYALCVSAAAPSGEGAARVYTCGEDRTLKVWHVQGSESGLTRCCFPRHFSCGLLAGSELEWSCEQSLAHPETVWHVAELPNQAS